MLLTVKWLFASFFSCFEPILIETWLLCVSKTVIKSGYDLECDGGEQYFCSVVSGLSQMARMTQISFFYLVGQRLSRIGELETFAAVYIKSPTDEGRMNGKCTFY